MSLDVTSLVLEELPLLRESSVLDVLRAGGANCVRLVTYFGSACGDKINTPYCDFIEEPLPLPSPASYEVQLRGLRNAPSHPLAVVIRLPKKDVQFLRANWQSRPHVRPFADSAKKQQ